MTCLPPSPRDLYRIWMRIINNVNESEKIPRYFGIETPLYPSEIHALQAIGEHPGSNVREIATILGITPGAGSQVISKLATRGLVRKVRGKKNEKEVHLELTSDGETAFQSHETTHEMVYQRIVDGISPVSEDEARFLERILHGLEKVYDERRAELLTSSAKKTTTKPVQGEES